jgi:hypothetical protein
MRAPAERECRQFVRLGVGCCPDRVTGEMTAKSRTGSWALTHYDERWCRVLTEGLRLRDANGTSSYADEDDLIADIRVH